MSDPVELRKLKPGEYFKRKPDSKKVYCKGYYDRTTKSFECYDFDDINSTLFLKASTKVYTNFEF